MLYALLLKSANDVAVALAVDRAGSVPAFVARMNRRAAELGMTRTTFVTPNGLTYGKGPHDTTTARDLAKLAVVLCRLPEVLRLTRTKQYVLRRRASRSNSSTTTTSSKASPAATASRPAGPSRPTPRS